MTAARLAIPSLTGIRGIAAAWVLLYHLRVVLGTLPGFSWLQNLPIVATGWSGVDMFFVLSGFVLMRAHSAEFTALQARPILRFGVVRIARVYPVSTAVLVLIVLLVAADHGFTASYRHQHLGNLTSRAFLKTAFLATRWFLPGTDGDWNQPVWSLSAEILGYAAFPVVAWLLARRSWVTALTTAVACLGALAIYQTLSHVDLPEFDQRNAVIRMGCCFVAGAALARAVAVAPERLAAGSAMLSICAVGVILAGCLLPWVTVALPFAYAALILALAFQRGPIDRALSVPIAQFLGRISFPLYLLHVMPLLWLGYHLRIAHASVFISVVSASLYVALVIGAATVLNVAVERPAHRWGRRWTQRDPPGHVTWASRSTPR
jgi:peptidoglycan/LPS O-acetylase OafA/YrhL